MIITDNFQLHSDEKVTIVGIVNTTEKRFEKAYKDNHYIREAVYVKLKGFLA